MLKNTQNCNRNTIMNSPKNYTMNITLKDLLKIILIVSFLNSCNSSKEFINYDKVKEGEQLVNAKEITVNQLFNFWMFKKYPFKIDLNCHELYRDDNYTYFGKDNLKFLNTYPNLYKVQNDSLDSQFGHYKNIDGQAIRNEFWDLCVPQSDKDIWNNIKCTSNFSNPKYSFELQNEKIFITLHWKVSCNGIQMLNKTYTGYFDMNKLDFD